MSPEATIKQLETTFTSQAGGNIRPMDLQKVRTVSCLTGENYSKDPNARSMRDPQEQTDVQRAWLYSKDAAVTAVNNNPTVAVPQVQPYDNQLSLPLGDGVWALKPKADAPGFFRHVRTDVTIQKNKIITRK